MHVPNPRCTSNVRQLERFVTVLPALVVERWVVVGTNAALLAVVWQHGVVEMETVFVGNWLAFLVVVHAVDVGNAFVVLTLVMVQRIRRHLPTRTRLTTQAIPLQHGRLMQMHLRLNASSQHDFLLGSGKCALGIEHTYLVEVSILVGEGGVVVEHASVECDEMASGLFIVSVILGESVVVCCVQGRVTLWMCCMCKLSFFYSVGQLLLFHKVTTCLLGLAPCLCIASSRSHFRHLVSILVCPLLCHLSCLNLSIRNATSLHLYSHLRRVFA